MPAFSAFIVRQTVPVEVDPDGKVDTIVRFSADNEAARLARAQEIRANSEYPTRILRVSDLAATVVKTEPTGIVYGTWDLPTCRRMLRALSAAGTPEAQELYATIKAAVDAYVAAGG